MNKYIYAIISAMLFLGIMFFDSAMVLACDDDIESAESKALYLIEHYKANVSVSEYPYYVVVKSPTSSGKYSINLMYSAEPITSSIQYSNGRLILGTKDNKGFFSYCYSSVGFAFGCGGPFALETDYGSSDIITANHDIKHEDGTIRFPLTPHQQTLPMVVEKVQMTGVMTEILGLIPLVIGLLVLAISLRKGFLALQTLLHRA